MSEEAAECLAAITTVPSETLFLLQSDSRAAFENAQKLHPLSHV